MGKLQVYLGLVLTADLVALIDSVAFQLGVVIFICVSRWQHLATKKVEHSLSTILTAETGLLSFFCPSLFLLPNVCFCEL